MKPTLCPTLDLLSPFADGELDGIEHDVVASHVSRCAACAARVEEVRALDAMVAASFVTERAARGLPAPLRPVLALAAAAALLLAIAPFFVSDRDESTEPTETTVATEVVEDLRPPIEVPNVEVETDSVPNLTYGERVRERIAAFAADEPRARERFATLGARGLVEARRVLRYGDDDLARAALDLLVRLEDRGAVGAMVAALERPALFAAAAAGIARLGDDTLVPALLEQIDTTMDASRRDVLVGVLERLDPRRAAVTLAGRAADGDENALKRLDQERERFLPWLRRAARSDDLARAHEALHVLGRLRDAGAVPMLATLLAEPDPHGAVAVALVRIGTPVAVDALIAADRGTPDIEHAFGLAEERVEKLLIERLGTTDHQQRKCIVRYLGRCGGEASVAALARLADDPALAADAMAALGSVGRRHPGAIAALARPDTQGWLRESRIRALGATGRREAIAPLLGLAVDVAAVREVALALAIIDRDEARDALRHLHGKSGRPVESALQVLHPELVAILHATDPPKRTKPRSDLGI